MRFQVDDLPGQTVGNEADGIVTLDVNAAGYGWFVDPTPAENEEFNPTTITSQFVADSQSAAAGRIDLLTVIEHELGHVLGLSDVPVYSSDSDIMTAELAPGITDSRR